MKKKFAVIFILSGFTLSCSTSEMIKQGAQAAVSGNPKKVLEASLHRTVERKAVEYERNPEQIVKDLKAAKAEFDKVMSFLMKAAGKEWGEKEAKVPEKKTYVKYVQNYQSRSIVNFDTGVIRVETVAGEDADKKLKSAIVTTLLTPDDPRAVDLFSDKQVELKGTPFLHGLVTDKKGKAIDGPEEAEAFADYLVKERSGQRVVEVGGTAKTVRFAEFNMMKDYNNRNAKKYDELVTKHSQKFNVSKSLVLAVIRTESNFNPFAVSPVPAYGLMQLVPSSGGREGYRKAKGEDVAPSADYLYDAGNNIELGTALLNVLERDQFSDVADPVSREYCVISGYNTGRGNVLKAFSKDRKEAVGVINSMPPESVYKKLVKDLPYEETRQYLVRVTTNRKQFVNQ